MSRPAAASSRRLLAFAALCLALPAASALAQSRIFSGTWGFGGTSRGRVYRYETGTTWTELSPPTSLGDAVWDLEWYEDALFAATHEGPSAVEGPPGGSHMRSHGDVGRVWRNDGSGAGFVDVSPPGGFDSAATSLAIADGELYATIDQDGLYRWDGGTSWTLIDTFFLAGQSIASDTHDGRTRVFIGQDNIDEFWSFDPQGLSSCPSIPTCQEPPNGAVCTANCYGGSCIHAMAEHDDGDGGLVYAGAFMGAMYRWNQALYEFEPLDDVPGAGSDHVEALASYHGLLHVGMSDGNLYSTEDGSASSYAPVMGFGASLPVIEALTVPDQDLLWLGFGGVPYRWAQPSGVSLVKTWNGVSAVDRSIPGSFGQGVLSLLAVLPVVVCDAGPAQAFECGPDPVEVTLDGSGSTVPNQLLGYTAAFEWSGDFLEGTATGVSPTVHVQGLGDHHVTLTIRVGTLSWSCETIVSVVDTTPPVFEGTVQCLWPPTHRYRCFDLASLVEGGVEVATDGCDGAVDVHVGGVRSSQPEDELGHGDASTQDDVVFDETSVCVRQERQGVHGDGRDYVVTLVATDASGNETIRQAIIHVPHDMRPDRRCEFHPVDPGLPPQLEPPLAPVHFEGTYPAATRPPRR